MAAAALKALGWKTKKALLTCRIWQGLWCILIVATAFAEWSKLFASNNKIPRQLLVNSAHTVQ